MTQLFDFPNRDNKGRGGNSGEPPHNGDMDARLAKLEALIPTLSTKEEVVKLRGETKEGFADLRTSIESVRGEINTSAESVRSEMHKGTAEIIKWIVVTAVGLGVAAITVGTFVLNNAMPKAPASANQQPIVITLPQGYERGNGAPTPPAKP